MAKSFTFATALSSVTLISKAKAAARAAGAEFVGDETSGRFAGKGVAGHYVIRQDETAVVSVTIIDKPFRAPWGIVESKVRVSFE